MSPIRETYSPADSSSGLKDGQTMSSRRLETRERLQLAQVP